MVGGTIVIRVSALEPVVIVRFWIVTVSREEEHFSEPATVAIGVYRSSAVAATGITLTMVASANQSQLSNGRIRALPSVP